MSKQYQPIEPTISASVVTALDTIIHATTDDGESLVVTADAAVGDYIVIQPDGSRQHIAKADFEAHYKPV